MIKYTAAELMRRLERDGVAFRSFSLVHEGDYTVDDADWNYKDVPHLHYIHQLVEAYPAAMGDKFIASVNLQKILGIRVPLTVFNYESGEKEQTYFTTLGFFVLVICTRYEQLAELRCRVTTTYSFGAPRWLLFLFPVVKWVLSRNYADLMSGDIPMRARRGELRAWGARFIKPGDTYSFRDTTNVAKKNVIFPSETAREKGGVPQPTLVRESIDLDGLDAEYFLGRSDEFGLRIVAEKSDILAFPRACDHEGACLDGPRLSSGQVQCPWHGKRIMPVFKIKRDGESASQFKMAGIAYRARFDGRKTLTVELVASDSPS